MNDKLIRSAAPHSVTFNEVTHNAIRSTNDLTAGEKKEFLISTDVDQVETSDEIKENNSTSIIQDNSSRSNLAKFDADVLKEQNASTVKRAHIKKNIQKLEVESPLDENLYKEALHRLEDRVQHLKNKNISSNNQKITDEVLSNNSQLLSENERIEKNLVYVGKKNIKDHLIQINSHSQYLSTSEDVDKSDIQKNQPAENNRQTAQSIINEQSIGNPSHEASKTLENHEALEESELQAQIRMMKEKLRKANKELIDIQQQDK